MLDKNMKIWNKALLKWLSKKCDISFQVNLDEATDPWGVKVIYILAFLSLENFYHLMSPIT